MGKKITHEEFKTAFETKYDGILELRNSVYKSSREAITVYCVNHGPFDRTPSALINDTRSRHPCPTCLKEIQAKEVIEGWKDYLEKIKKVVDCTNLDFSKVDYKGSQKQIMILYLVDKADKFKNGRLSKLSWFRNLIIFLVCFPFILVAFFVSVAEVEIGSLFAVLLAYSPLFAMSLWGYTILKKSKENQSLKAEITARSYRWMEQ